MGRKNAMTPRELNSNEESDPTRQKSHHRNLLSQTLNPQLRTRWRNHIIKRRMCRQRALLTQTTASHLRADILMHGHRHRASGVSTSCHPHLCSSSSTGCSVGGRNALRRRFSQGSESFGPQRSSEPDGGGGVCNGLIGRFVMDVC